MNRFWKIDRCAWALCLLLIGPLAVPAAAERVEPMRRDGDYRPFPHPGPGYVTDHAGLLSPREMERIQRLLWQAESQTGTEIIVVIISSRRDYPGVEASSIEAFARRLFDAYGVGNLPANDGVLLLVAHQDREARIELGAGYGRRREAEARRIMDRTIVPHFRQGEYAKGIDRGVQALLREFAGLRIITPWHVLAAVLVALLLGGVAYSLFKRGKRGWGWVFVGLFVVFLLFVIHIALAIVRHLPSGHSSGWSSGGRGGFGGGFSGGGGATGRW